MVGCQAGSQFVDDRRQGGGFPKLFQALQCGILGVALTLAAAEDGKIEPAAGMIRVVRQEILEFAGRDVQAAGLGFGDRVVVGLFVNIDGIAGGDG